MRPLPGISAKIVDDDGNELQPAAEHGEHVTGYLVLDKPWPSMLRGIWGDPERFVETYWSRFADRAGTSPAMARVTAATVRSGCWDASMT